MIGFAPRAERHDGRYADPPTRRRRRSARAGRSRYEHRTAPSSRAADDRREIVGMSMAAHHELFVADRVIRPREHVVTGGRRTIGAWEHREAGRRPSGHHPRQPRDKRDPDEGARHARNTATISPSLRGERHGESSLAIFHVGELAMNRCRCEQAHPHLMRRGSAVPDFDDQRPSPASLRLVVYSHEAPSICAVRHANGFAPAAAGLLRRLRRETALRAQKRPAGRFSNAAPP